MNPMAKIALLLSAMAMTGMAVVPERIRDNRAQEKMEDEVLIAELDTLEDQAIAEDYEFLIFLEILDETKSEKPIQEQKEAE